MAHQKFEPHEFIWTQDASSRFWDILSDPNAFRQDSYFSKQVGSSILDFTLRYVDMSGRVLDYGCGPGYLLDSLLQRGIACEGVDFSAGSVEQVNSRLSGDSHFRGVTYDNQLPTSLESDAYDMVFFVETLEHILPKYLPDVLKELARLTKTGGHLVLTTPNEEDLNGRNRVLCPECGSLFHRWQHVNSWSTETVGSLMYEYGFKPIACKATTLRPKTPINLLKRLVEPVVKRKPPHLVYIGQKIESIRAG